MDISTCRDAELDACISSSEKSPLFRTIAISRRSLFSLCISVLLASVFFLSPSASQQQTAHALSNGVALTPPMGWSSWNSHFANINASVIRSAADAVVSSGMQTAGYQYVNTDEGWWTGTRDSSGNITVNTSNWPGGMQALAAYIHSKGLKAGIYTDAGVNGCGGTNQGSYGHYDQDMLQFELWGFDYVKVDWCGGRDMGLDPATQYGQIRDSIARATAQTGHPMAFSICVWGVGNPWNWGAATGNQWRTSTDISFTQNSASWSGVLANFDAAQHPSGQTVGAYNDPDMMEVGAPGLSATESQSHFSLWAISGAPLLAGNDITTMSTTTRDVLTNSEVIAVNQDSLGLQGILVSQPASGLQVYSKVLSGSGQRAVALLNRTGSTANITVNWSNIGLTSASASVRNLWTHTNAGSFSSSYTASVPSHGVVMLKISGTASGSGFGGNFSSSAHYKLVNLNSGKDLDVNQASTADGGAVVQWTDNGGNNQKWNLVPATGGYYKLVNVNSGKDLDVNQASTADGGAVVQWTDNGGANQRWMIVALSGGYYKLVNTNSDKNLDVYNNSTADGGAVVQWTDDGGNNQQWGIVQVS